MKEDDIEEIAKKVPMRTDELKQAIPIVFRVLQEKRDGCTIRELRERVGDIPADVLTDTLASLLLAQKAIYTGDKSRTLVRANTEVESFIISYIYDKEACPKDELLQEAEKQGISRDDVLEALKGQRIRDRVIIEDGKVKSLIQGPPAKPQDWQRATSGAKNERYYEEPTRGTYGFVENEFAKDQERILYSSAFRRLAGVTQVVGTSEAHVFHNRLTHSIKAGQIARSIALRLDPQAQVNPDVVEVAALAHDLGHPPFGHTGESELDRLLTERDVLDGYEGNAQNLRIVTQLARVRSEFRGLNLTRATLNALMKYPWSRDAAKGTKKHKKWNVYSTEERFFKFARSMIYGEEKSNEAQVMEWADDIAYGVHDIEDGIRAGMIPLNELLNDKDERQRFLEGSRDWWEKQQSFNNSKHDAERAFNILFVAQRDLRRPYEDDAAQRAALRQLTTTLHHRYILAVTLDDNQLRFRPEYEREVTILKCLMRFYVFCNPVLLPQQYGQRRVISALFRYFFEAAQSPDPRDRNVLPARVRELFDEGDSRDTKARAGRAAADTVAGMTELEALAMHRRVTGMDAGGIRDRIVY